METSLSVSKRHPNTESALSLYLANDRLVAFGLFWLTLLPRIFSLGLYITGDEPRWVVRSIAFLTGLLTFDFQATLQTGHPGVTTMWSGSLGLILDYLLNHRTEGSLLAFVQSLPQNPQQIDPTVLPWVRLPIVLLTALSVVALFWFLRSLDRNIAIIAALLLAFHPIYLGNSQLLHHDALVSVFVIIAILLFLTGLRSWSWRWMVISGVAAGLAILSKSTAYALIPFVGLSMIIEIVSQRMPLRRAMLGGVVWGLSALATVVLLWPAIWVAPVEVWHTVFGWVDESANVSDVSNTLIPNFNDRFPDLGIFFYPVNWLLKSTPLTILGLVFFFYAWRQQSSQSVIRWWALQLWLWIGLFSIMLTLGDKRDGRYLLPIYFALAILAAMGLTTVYQILKRKYLLNLKIGSLHLNIYQIGFVVILLGFSLSYYPYYLAYYNPLIGGQWLAPRLIKVGLGDGMEQAAAWLNDQPNASQLSVATDLEQTFWPFFEGQVVTPNTPDIFTADYVLNYIRSIQNGVPFPEYWQYYEARPPAYKVKIAGIDFLWLHKEPPLATLGRIPVSDDLILRAYTLDQPLAAPGTPLNVTLIWRGTSSPEALVRLQLRNEAGNIWSESPPAPVIDPLGPSSVEGHYTLQLPADTPRGRYRLRVNVNSSEAWAEVVEIPVGHRQPTETIPYALEANFGNQIALHGFDISTRTPAAGETIILQLYWQALQSVPNSYTTFIHLVDSTNQAVVAQSDVLPGQGQWLTNTWFPNEWITDQVPLYLPAELPKGEYNLLVGWYHLETGQRLPVLTDNDEQTTVMLGSVTIR